MHGARRPASPLLGAAALAALLLLAACGEEGPAAVPPAPPGRAKEPALPQEPPPEATPASHALLRVIVEWPDRKVGERRAEVTARFADGSRRSGTTDALGEVFFVGVPPGDADLWARAAHPLYGLGDCRVEPEGESEGYVYLDEGVAISGRVLDAASGAPVEGAVVGVPWCMDDWPRGRPGPGGGVTDAEGRYEAWWVLRDPKDHYGMYRLAALARHHALAVVALPNLAFSEHRAAIDILLDPGGSAHGRVTRPDGVPAPGARVVLRTQTGAEPTDGPGPDDRSWIEFWSLREARTDAEGRYELLGLPFGTVFQALANAPGYASSDAVRDLAPTAAAPDVVADLVLHEAGRLRVRVVDPEGDPAADVDVYLESFSDYSEQTNEDGVLDFEGVEAGRHLLYVSARSWPEIVREVEAPAGRTTEVLIRLDAGVAIEGVLVDTAGTPLSGMRVEAAPLLGNHGGSAPTDVSGRFRIAGLSSGRYRLHAGDEIYGALDGEETVVDAPSTTARVVVLPYGWLRIRLRGLEVVQLPAYVTVRYGDDDAHERRADYSRTRDGDVIYVCRVPAGQRTYRFEVEECASVERTLDVPAGEAALHVEVPVGTGPDLEGRVIDPEGRPLPEVWIEVVGVWPRRTVTDARGRFRIPRLAPGRTRLCFTADDRATLEREHDHGPDAAPLVVVLPRGGLLRGRVVDASGRGLAWQEVDARDAEDPQDAARSHAIRTDEDGAFSVRIPAGRYAVGLVGGDVFHASIEVTVEEGGDVQVELRAGGR